MVSAAMAAVSVLESHCLDLSVCRKPCGIGWQSGKRTTVIPDGVCSVDAELSLRFFWRWSCLRRSVTPIDSTSDVCC